MALANTVRIALTDRQVELAITGGGLGLDVERAVDGKVHFQTTQTEARLNSNLLAGDRVLVIAMSDDGALGLGSHFWGSIEQIDFDGEQGPGIAWVEQVRG